MGWIWHKGRQWTRNDSSGDLSCSEILGDGFPVASGYFRAVLCNADLLSTYSVPDPMLGMEGIKMSDTAY